MRVTIKRQVMEEISFEAAGARVEDIGSTENEPFEVFCRKVNALAELLDITFEQAERLLLERV